MRRKCAQCQTPIEKTSDYADLCGFNCMLSLVDVYFINRSLIITIFIILFLTLWGYSIINSP